MLVCKELLSKLTNYENKMMLVLTAQLIVGRSCCSWLRDRTVGDTKRERRHLTIISHCTYTGWDRNTQIDKSIEINKQRRADTNREVLITMLVDAQDWKNKIDCELLKNENKGPQDFVRMRAERYRWIGSIPCGGCGTMGGARSSCIDVWLASLVYTNRQYRGISNVLSFPH